MRARLGTYPGERSDRHPGEYRVGESPEGRLGETRAEGSPAARVGMRLSGRHQAEESPVARPSELPKPWGALRFPRLSRLLGSSRPLGRLAPWGTLALWEPLALWVLPVRWQILAQHSRHKKYRISNYPLSHGHTWYKSPQAPLNPHAIC
jgi:hypothetical protein